MQIFCIENNQSSNRLNLKVQGHSFIYQSLKLHKFIPWNDFFEIHKTVQNQQHAEDTK